MARDYKNIAQKKTAQPSKLAGVLPFFTGLSLGLVVTFIVYLNQSDGSYMPFQAKPEPTGPAPSANTSNVTTTDSSNNTSQPTPTFDFYNILPNKEINISEWVAEEVTVQEMSSSPTAEQEKDFTMEENSVYILQVGSFKQLEAADQVKAQLALLGVMADIQRVVINGQDTLYRVRIGPYGDAEQLNQARQRLQQNNLEFMLLKLQADDPRATEG